MLKKSLNITIAYTLTFLVLSIQICSGQKFILQKAVWNYQKKTAMAITALNDYHTIDSSDFKKIFSSYKIKEYSKCKVPLQTFENGKKDDFLNFVLFITYSDSVIVICDKDRDTYFANDTIYWFRAKSENEKVDDISKELVNITLNKIPLKDKNNDIIYEKADFFIRPNLALKNGHYVFNKYPLSLYLKNYNTLFFKLNDKEYEMAIFSHPLVQSFYTAPNLLWNENSLIYAIFKLNTFGKDSTITSFKSLNDLTTNGLNHTQIIDGKSMTVEEHNDTFTELTLKFTDAVAPIYDNNILADLNAKNIINNNVEYPFKKDKIKLLIFGGSWCLPCKKVLPELKKLYIKNKKNIEVFEILIEKNIADAKNYRAKNKIPWTLYYEELNGKSKNPIQSFFHVFIYPSFYLIGKNNHILLNTNSDEGLESINEKIISIGLKL